LDAYVEQDYSRNQAGHVFADKIKNDKGKERNKERDQNISPCAIAVGEVSDEGSANGSSSADQAEQAGDSAAVVIGRRLQKEDQSRPEGTEGAKQDRAQRCRFSKNRLFADQHGGGAN
jgi:hypothetical protein